MRFRTLDKIPNHVITSLILVCLEPEEIAHLLGREIGDEPLRKMVLDLVWQSKASARKARIVEGSLDHALEDLRPTGNCISELSPGPSQAYRSQDPMLLAAILWHVAKRQGLAWRRLEVRLQAALLVFVVTSSGLQEQKSARRKVPGNARSRFHLNSLGDFSPLNSCLSTR